MSACQPTHVAAGSACRHAVNPLQAVIDAGWALSYLTDGDDSRIRVAVDAGAVPPLCTVHDQICSAL